MAFLELVTVVVDDYDPAIEFFVDVLGFELGTIPLRSPTMVDPSDGW